MLTKVIPLFMLLCTPPMALSAATPGGFFQKPSEFSMPSLRVLVVHDTPNVTLEVQGKYKIFDPNSKEHVSTRFIGKKQRLESSSVGLKWGEEFPDIHQLVFIPAEPTTQILINGTSYPGHLYVYDIGSSISIVNQIEIEDLLRLSEPSQEKGASLPQEVLAALAITTRTNLYYDRAHPRNKFWDVTAEALNYRGNVAEPDAQWNKAVNETKFMVMSDAQAGQTLSPQPVDWKPDEKALSLAEQGNHAAQILSKAFPDMNIKIAFKPNEK